MKKGSAQTGSGLRVRKWPGPDLNRYSPEGESDFKSDASASSATGPPLVYKSLQIHPGAVTPEL